MRALVSLFTLSIACLFANAETYVTHTFGSSHYHPEMEFDTAAKVGVGIGFFVFGAFIFTSWIMIFIDEL